LAGGGRHGTPIARVLLVALAALALGPSASARENPVQRGRYLLLAAGCITCHTDAEHKGPLLAGGRRFETPFGVFYAPNITSDRRYGIGTWTAEQFVTALRRGVGPGGKRYYPVFPYPSYAGMRREDLRALWAYLRTVPPAATPSRAHELPWYMRWRIVNRGWQLLFFRTTTLRDDPAKSPLWNRGAYLVRALAHCGECHTPRTRFGALDWDMAFAGTRSGPDGDSVPNITPDRETGIGSWSHDELLEYLSSGMRPDADFAGGLMAEVIDDGLSHLRREDLEAIVTYLRARKPIRNRISRPARPSDEDF